MPFQVLHYISQFPIIICHCSIFSQQEMFLEKYSADEPVRWD
jgi:hypothetical protein